MLQNNNQIGGAGAAGLIEGLKVNSSLQELYLVRLFVVVVFSWGRCRARAGRGSAALTRVLQMKNQIGVSGAAGLIEGLKVNSSLQELYLVRLFVVVVFSWG